jgi:hypothetical protein
LASFDWENGGFGGAMEFSAANGAKNGVAAKKTAASDDATRRRKTDARGGENDITNPFF